MHRLAMLTATFWTANRDLVGANVVLAAAAVGTAFVGVRTIKSSNAVAKSAEKLAKSAEDQAKATNSTVEKASEQISLGKDSLEQERAALQASIRPMVVDVPMGLIYGPIRVDGEPRLDRGKIQWSFISDAIAVIVPFRNIGLGPAFVHEALLTTAPGSVYKARTNYRVIPTDEIALVSLAVSASDMAYPAVKTAYMAGHIAAALKYSDLGDGQRTQTVLHLDRTVDRDSFIVSKVELYHCDDNWIRDIDPFVSTGPS